MKALKSTLLATIFASTPAFAFDDNRQGFMLGIGGGFTTLKAGTYESNGSTWSAPEYGLATSFKMGWGITDQVALSYVQNDSWYREYYSSSAPKQSTFTIGISGIGVTYFMEPTAPCSYILAAAGVGYTATPFETSDHRETGHAFMFGGGYEYEKHFTVEGTILVANYDSGAAPAVNLKSSALQI
ncbi:MAG: hypothetical protein WCF09_08055, partial [Gallionella sp.]